jgi:hypothetical protein
MIKFVRQIDYIQRLPLYGIITIRTHCRKNDIFSQFVFSFCITISYQFFMQVAFGQEFDEDELEAELNELEAEGDIAEQEELDRQLLNVGPSAAETLPEVPSAEPARPVPAAKAKPKPVAEDDDLAELAAWAS